MQLFLLKAWFPYDRYDCCDHCDRWEKKSSVIAAIIWKPLSRVRSNNDRWDRKNSISAIGVAAIATIAGKWFPYDHYDLYHAITVLFFLSDHSDRSDHMETRLKLRIFTTQNTFQ